jgi:CRP/FNR family transcriptional regulator, cyclic AMP receptor protein
VREKVRNPRELEKHLREQLLFRNCKDHLISSLSELVRVESIEPGDYVCFQGDVDAPLILILSGHLRASTMSEDGQEIPIHEATAGDSMGASSIVADSPIQGNVVAVEDSTVALLSRAHARQFFRDPEVAHGLNDTLVSLVGRILKRHFEQQMPRAASRVSAVIASVLADTGSDSSLLKLPSQATIAAMAKVSRETVSRVLGTLERDGVIAKHGRRIRVQNRSALSDIALNRSLA